MFVGGAWLSYVDREQLAESEAVAVDTAGVVRNTGSAGAIARQLGISSRVVWECTTA